MKEIEIKKFVREGYAGIASRESSCCGSESTCCSSQSTCCDSPVSARDISRSIGYSEQDIDAVPEGANLGLGCGNPVALASLQEGETVLDLGSGGGFDCFLAAARVGKTGNVIGVDMTPEMVARARENAGKGDFANVEFRLGEIENLPVADSSVDVIISNCVINLASDKKRVFRESFRVLKPGGRLMVSDIVLTKELPEAIMNSVAMYIGCISGAALKIEYLEDMEAAGFQDITLFDQSAFPVDCLANDPAAQSVIKDLELTQDSVAEITRNILSVKVSAIKAG
jgi:arsenite methyltransferase